MPELPEVEVLVRRLCPLLQGKRITGVRVMRSRSIRGTTCSKLAAELTGARIKGIFRRGKYLVFNLQKASRDFSLLGHLGMTGRMYVQVCSAPLPKHTAVVLELGKRVFVFEDTRYFGRLTLDSELLNRLGPEPLAPDFPLAEFLAGLRASSQPIKVKLLDQRLLAGVGNIYASEALFRAGISPKMRSNRLSAGQGTKLYDAVKAVLEEAIQCGSTIPLNLGPGKQGLFYFGTSGDAQDHYSERLQVYDRAGRPCPRCGESIRQATQAGRSTYFCRGCQK